MLLNSPFSPKDWYWRDDAGTIFSSARNIVVSATDTAYVAFCASAYTPTVWPRDNAGNQTAAALNCGALRL